ncbi:hypothetical protein TNCV_1739101 [Trichonephila clavipes]|nr:hypothetical protein TNCV_1739101 [Trichonephila clavipes]
MLVGLLSRWCFLIGGHGWRQWAGRTVGFGGLRKNQVQIRASRREARLLLVVRSRSSSCASASSSNAREFDEQILEVKINRQEKNTASITSTNKDTLKKRSQKMKTKKEN